MMCLSQGKDVCHPIPEPYSSDPLLLLLALLLLFQTRPQLRRSILEPDAQEAAKGQAVDLVAAALEEVREATTTAAAAPAGRAP
jgi:hypothetical protein